MTARRAVVEAVAPRFDEVVERATDRAREEIPAYARLPRDELREGIAGDLGRAMAAFVDNRPLTAEEDEAMSAIGDRRARQGIPLESMLRVYRITVDEVFSVLWEAYDQGLLDQDQAVTLTRDVWRYADPMMEVAVVAYRRREVEQALAASEQRTALVHALLLSSDGAPAGLISSAGLDPNARYVAIRARPAPGDDSRGLLLDLQTPGVTDGGEVAAYEGDVIGFAPRRPGLVPRDGACVGVGPARRLSELPRSFAVASRVLDTAIAFGRRGVVRIDDLPLEAIARSEDILGESLVERYVTPLRPGTPGGAELLATVRAFIDSDLSAERAAETLDVHPNTVRNRLHRYEQLTRARLTSVDDLFRIRWALLRAELEPPDASAQQAAG